MKQKNKKTEGKKIFFPVSLEEGEPELKTKFGLFETALSAYYSGDWNSARKSFKDCGLEAAQVFLERMGRLNAPDGWMGIWTMTTK